MGAVYILSSARLWTVFILVAGGQPLVSEEIIEIIVHFYYIPYIKLTFGRGWSTGGLG